MIIKCVVIEKLYFLSKLDLDVDYVNLEFLKMANVGDMLCGKISIC